MPFAARRPRNRPRRRRRNYGRKPGAPLGRAPRWNLPMRVSQGLTRNVFCFKATGAVPVSGTDTQLGRIYEVTKPNDVLEIEAFTRFAWSFEQYKVLKVVMKWFPASVGSESVNPTLFHRGNLVSWVDQPPLMADTPVGINEIMSLPTARIQQPRRFFKRFINRPRGGRYLDWSPIQHILPGGAPAPTEDKWNTQIKCYGDNFGAGDPSPPMTKPPYFFFENLFKVVFRARHTG